VLQLLGPPARIAAFPAACPLIQYDGRRAPSANSSIVVVTSSVNERPVRLRGRTGDSEWTKVYDSGVGLGKVSCDDIVGP
jgi:hypothetical protein